jgi:flagellar biosynthesis/type III secretory pathway chaperone
MTTDSTQILSAQLASILEQLIALQEELHSVIERKQTMMRRADVEGILNVAQEEGALVGKVMALDRQRVEVVAKMCQALSIPATGSPSAISISQLAARLEVAARTRLVKLAQVLRQAMLKVAQANRVVQMASHQLLDCVRNVFSIILEDASAVPVYSRDGELSSTASAKVLDAVG